MKSPYPGSVGTTPDSIGGAVQAEPPDTDETSCPRCGESHDLAKVKGCIKCCNVFTVTDHGRRGRVTCGGDTLATMHLQSAHTSTRWVFVRHSECIQVSTRELSVTIDGPHRTRDRYHFDCERDLQSFQMTLAEQLTERGWLLCASKSS